MTKRSSWRGALSAFPRPHALAAALGVAALATFLAIGLPADEDQSVAAVALPPASQPAEPAAEIVGVQAGDTFASLLADRGIDAATVHAIMSSGAAARALSSIRAGTVIEVLRDDDGLVQQLSYSPNPLSTLTIRRNAATGGYDSELVEKPTVTVTRYADGVIEDSLFGSGKRAGVGDGVILKMADIFGYDIDFALEVQQGDTFRVMFEEVLVDGQRIRDGEILSAEFVNQGKTYRAVRFAAGGKATYYTPEGMAMRKAFLRSPVDFARISSGFNLKRRHPVLHTLRAHKGVDYAASRGTPVRATADGRVEYAGNKGGYGRTVILQHGNRYSTLYAHLDRLAANVRNGSRVSQGQIVGYVGSTGLSTGPHLHYEFRVAGAHVDPLKAKPIQAEPIAGAHRQAFVAEATRLFALMDTYAGTTAVAQTDTALPAGTSRL